MREGTVGVLLGLLALQYAPIIGIVIILIACLLFVYTESNREKAQKEPEIIPYTKEELYVIDMQQDRALLVNEWAKYMKSTGETVYWRWKAKGKDANEIEIYDENFVYYDGYVTFAEPGDEDCRDQPRVTKVTSYIRGTNVYREWPVKPMNRVPISSIQKNIANSFKNDKKLRALVEEAHSQCLIQGYGIIELDKIHLDFDDNRVKKEFLRRCLVSGNFKSAHLQSNGHEVKVFAGNSDPLP